MYTQLLEINGCSAWNNVAVTEPPRAQQAAGSVCVLGGGCECVLSLLETNGCSAWNNVAVIEPPRAQQAAGCVCVCVCWVVAVSAYSVCWKQMGAQPGIMLP